MKKLASILTTALIPLFFSNLVYAYTGIAKFKSPKTSETRNHLTILSDKGYNCTVEYSAQPVSGRYKVFKITCENGFKVSNPDGDRKVDEICLKYKGELSCFSREQVNKKYIIKWFLPIEESIKPGGTIDNYIKDVESSLGPSQ